MGCVLSASVSSQVSTLLDILYRRLFTGYRCGLGESVLHLELTIAELFQMFTILPKISKRAYNREMNRNQGSVKRYQASENVKSAKVFMGGRIIYVPGNSGPATLSSEHGRFRAVYVSNIFLYTIFRRQELERCDVQHTLCRCCGFCELKYYNEE